MKNALSQSLTAVGLVIILGFSGSLATQHEIKPGVERWPMKTSELARVDVSHGTPVAYVDLVKLDDPPASGRTITGIILRGFPRSRTRSASRRATSLRPGWLHLVAWESDGDYH